MSRENKQRRKQDRVDSQNIPPRSTAPALTYSGLWQRYGCNRIGYAPPWIGYFAQLDNELVGSAGFKSEPKEGKVEIAYGTFPTYQWQGVGSQICSQLVRLTLQTDPSIRITARTFEPDNYSARILKKNGFSCNGPIWDEEDGTVWEWEY